MPQTYHKKLISLPEDIWEELNNYSQSTNQTGNYIIFQAIKKFLKSNSTYKLKKEIKKIHTCKICGEQRSRNSANYCWRCSNRRRSKNHGN